MDTMIFTAPGTISKVITLDGYECGSFGWRLSYNVIPYLFEINLVRNPSKPVLTSEKITINETFQVVEYDYIKGYLGRFDILDFSQNQRLDIFDKQVEGNVFIKRSS